MNARQVLLAVALAMIVVVAAGEIVIQAAEPSAADKGLARGYLDTHLADENYEEVRWHVEPPNQNGARAVYVTVRFKSSLGGPAIDTFLIWIRDGKVTAAYDRAVFPGSPEDEAGHAYQDFMRAIAGGKSSMPKAKGSAPVAKANRPTPLSKEGEAVKSPLATWTPPANSPFWVTLDDGTRVCGKLSRDGDSYTINTRYGRLIVDRKSFVTVRKAIPPE